MDSFSPKSHTKRTSISLSQSCTDLVDFEDDEVMDIASPFSSMSFLMSLQEVEEKQDDEYIHDLDTLLAEHGYTKERVICNTLQGTMYEVTKNGTNFAIKRASKELYFKHEAVEDEDGVNVVVEEDILKEANILHYLTVTNAPIGGYIVKYIDFFESDTDYYLVMEYAGDMNLAEFTETAHSYIQKKKLSLTNYKKVIKFISWQISVTLSWLHDMMNVCHLDLCLENIMICGNPFIHNADGSVALSQDIKAKLCDFGLAEVFDINSTGFKCNKWSLKDSYNCQSPKVYKECTYDAIKADIWSFGCILFKMYTNRYLYASLETSHDVGFWALTQHKLELYIESERLKVFVHGRLLKLLQCMLNCDESLRCSTQQILKSSYFQWYYDRYGARVQKKAVLQQKQNRCRYQNIPLYSINVIIA